MLYMAAQKFAGEHNSSIAKIRNKNEEIYKIFYRLFRKYNQL